MLRRLIEIFSRRRLWLGTSALLALAPKCFFCVAAYATAGTALGLRSREMCGATSGSAGTWHSALAAVGIVLCLTAISARHLSRANAAPERRPSFNPALGDD